MTIQPQSQHLTGKVFSQLLIYNYNHAVLSRFQKNLPKCCLFVTCNSDSCYPKSLDGAVVNFSLFPQLNVKK